MADQKISDMTTASTVGGTDITPIVQSGTNKKATFTVIKNFLAGFFAQVFTDLTDVPGSYSGQSLKGVRVNTGETALEFFTATGGGDALTSNPLSQFASTTSLQLKGVMSDETGSGALVFGTSPALTTPTGIVKGDVGLGSVTNDAQTKAAIVPNTVPSAGQLLAGNAGGTAYAPVTVSGSGATITVSSAGVITISAIPNASLSGAPSGTIVGTTDTQTFTNKRTTPRITTITSSATPTVNTDNCDAVTITALAAAITSMTTNLSGTPNNFDKLIVRLKDDGTARAITWGASFASSAATLPTTTVISKVLTVGLIWDSVQTKWICLATDQAP